MATWAPSDGVVELPDGRLIRGRGVRVPAGADFVRPEFGVYLLATRPEEWPWEHRLVRWPDFGIPWSMSRAVSALCEAHDRAADERVEVACGGGTGRTGSALAVLATLSGVAPDAAVTWVREHYRPHAVETRQQQRWVVRAAERARALRS